MKSIANKKVVRPRGTDSARMIKVIETRALRGNGEDDDPVRAVKQFWNLDGNLIAENDPFSYEDYKMLYQLKDIPTKQLVEGLIGRDGVEKTVIQPYEKTTVKAEGPAMVLIIKD